MSVFEHQDPESQQYCTNCVSFVRSPYIFTEPIYSPQLGGPMAPGRKLEQILTWHVKTLVQFGGPLTRLACNRIHVADVRRATRSERTRATGGWRTSVTRVLPANARRAR